MGSQGASDDRGAFVSGWEDYLCTHARTPHGSYNLRLTAAAPVPPSVWPGSMTTAMCAALAYGMQLARGDMATSDHCAHWLHPRASCAKYYRSAILEVTPG